MKKTNPAPPKEPKNKMDLPSDYTLVKKLFDVAAPHLSNEDLKTIAAFDSSCVEDLKNIQKVVETMGTDLDSETSEFFTSENMATFLYVVSCAMGNTLDIIDTALEADYGVHNPEEFRALNALEDEA
jgi:hypothetical protein